MKTKIAQENFVKWNDALLAGNPKKVADLYASDATFLPTVSGEFKKGQVGAEEYFEHFLEKHPVGTIIADETQILGPKSYLHSGMYNFEIDDNLSGRKIIKARFSFVWMEDNSGKWKIIHHHLSIKPN